MEPGVSGLFIDSGTAITIAGAICTPLISVIVGLWLALNKERKDRNDDNNSWQTKWDAMRDRYQEKVDSANQKANDAISTVTTALNAMSGALSSNKDDKAKAVEDWRNFKDDILRAVREVK